MKEADTSTVLRITHNTSQVPDILAVTWLKMPNCVTYSLPSRNLFPSSLVFSGGSMGVNVYDHPTPQNQWVMWLVGLELAGFHWAVPPAGAVTALHPRLASLWDVWGEAEWSLLLFLSLVSLLVIGWISWIPQCEIRGLRHFLSIFTRNKGWFLHPHLAPCVCFLLV